MKDHKISELVTELTQVARSYGHTQQLRDRIAHIIVPHLKKVPEEEKSMAKDLVIFDIDGVLLDPKHRVQFWSDGDYDRYFASAPTDEPIEQGLEVCRMFLQNPRFQVLFVTGRGDTPQHRAATLEKLSHCLRRPIPSFKLLMRGWPIPEDEKYDDAVVKPKLITNAGYDLNGIFMVFEDRPSIVNMWRERGVICYQTEKGWD